MRMVNSKKISCGYALGVAPASEAALKQLKGAILPQVKKHVLSLGGRVDSQDDHITIALLKDTLDIPEDIDEVLPQGEWSTNKRGFLIPGAENRVISLQNVFRHHLYILVAMVFQHVASSLGFNCQAQPQFQLQLG